MFAFSTEEPYFFMHTHISSTLYLLHWDFRKYSCAAFIIKYIVILGRFL